MKVKELIEILQDCDPDTDINVLLHLPNRPYGGGILEPIHTVKPIVDQDTNKVNYFIDTGIGEEGRFQAYMDEKEGEKPDK
ncbi:hypothetical protein NQZ71_21050 (plasmid) [Niallia taxi]|uniref:hypothetical protein n=1 Tax=Niallia taxi TaxID=2499688 RepID=UPI002934141D|nr:hypothetical protein [Niallia taxi]WOD65695.1 hypothetical protein NQZ71_21050 [Niallia taxi]